MARKILLADDSVTAQNMGRKILTDAGYEVVAVNNGSAALKKLAEQKPDIIVLDVYMPGYSGLEVCQRIKDSRETARIPVLLTVGKLEPFKPEEARRARADAFVVKPFEASELLAALTKLEQKIAPEPEPYKPGRFAKAIASIDETSSEGAQKFGDSDEGWRARLRFPSKKKKAPEPEETPEIVAPRHDLREAEPAASAPARGKAEPTFERPLPAGLPRDITPEEIAAITAAAAQLSGSAVTPVPPAPEAPAIAAAPAAEQPIEAASAVSEPAVVAPPVEAAPAALSEAVAAEPAVNVTPEAVPAMSSLASSPVADGAEASAPATLANMPTAEIQPPATEPESSTEVVAAAVSSFEVVATVPVAPPSPIPEPSPVVAQAEFVAPVTNLAAEEPALPPVADLAPGPAPVLEAAPAQAEPAPAVAPPAHDEEVMAALQTLIPAAPAQPEAKVEAAESVPEPASLVAAVAEFATAGVPAMRPRWVAEEALPTADEVSTSLEKEMEKAFAALAASEAARLIANSALESLAGAHSGAEAALIASQEAAAVEPVQAPEPLAAPPEEPVPQPATAEAVSETLSEPVAAPAPVYAMASAAGAESSPSSLSATPIDATLASAEASSASFEVPSSSLPMPAAAELDAPPAFAETHTAAQEISSVTSDAALQVPPAPVSGEPELTHVEEYDPMSPKHSENLGFKMIRQSPAGAAKAAAKPAPVSKETFEPPVAEPESAAMAAAAAAETAPATAPAPQAASAPDPRAIASIVDSVLAELRPKIVEEIAKKLAEKKE